MSESSPKSGRLRRVARYLALAIVSAVAVACAAAWLLYERLDGNIHEDRVTSQLLDGQREARPPEAPKGAQNILILGSDLRQGEAGERSDTVMLLHVTGDWKRATAMSVPRDLMVNVPSCARPGGGSAPAGYMQFNWAFARAGASCTIRTLEQLTGIRVDHYLVLHFEDFKRVVNAVGGVRMCLPQPEKDTDVSLDLPAGCQLLRDENALAYVRARKGVADGSDTHRMARQQQFLSALAHQVDRAGVRGNPVRLFHVLDSATSAVTADPALASLDGMYALVSGVRKLPAEGITFVTVPRHPYPADPNRDVLQQPAADDLFRELREGPAAS